MQKYYLAILSLLLIVAKADAQLIEKLKNTIIKSEDFDMNDERFKNFSAIKQKSNYGRYELGFNHNTPFENAFVFRTVSKDEDPHLVFYRSRYTKFDSSKNYTTSPCLSATYAIDGADTTNLWVTGKSKIKFKFLTADVPIVFVEDLYDKSFKEQLLTLAYSAKFNFKNVVVNEKAAYLCWDCEEGILVKSRRYGFESGTIKGKFFQAINEDYSDKNKEIKEAKKYTEKVEEALKGLDYTVEECDGSNKEKCYELMGQKDNQFAKAMFNYVYIKKFTVAAPAGTVFFNDDQKALFTIIVSVDEGEKISSIEILSSK